MIIVVHIDIVNIPLEIGLFQLLDSWIAMIDQFASDACRLQQDLM